MSHHKIVTVSRTHIQVEDSDELIPKTDAWRACFGGTRNSGLGYYVRNDNAPDGWAATDPAEEVEPVKEQGPHFGVDPLDPSPAPALDSPASDPPLTEGTADPALWPPANPDESQR